MKPNKLRWLPVLGLGLAVSLSACEMGRKSPAGFSLPRGDVAAGKATFTKMKCFHCHLVAGVRFPPPVADPPVPVVLGGNIERPPTDGYLVTALVNPSHTLKHSFFRETHSGKGSRMPDYGSTMTVHELIDLVAFLQSIYKEPPR